MSNNAKHFVFEGEEKECWSCEFVSWKAGKTHYTCTNKKSKFYDCEIQYGDECDQFQRSHLLGDIVVIPKQATIAHVIENS